jgi:diguanylate cyclase (GGDEF)-like protein
MARSRHLWKSERIAMISGWLQPRDHAVAARTVSTLCMVAAGVTIVFAFSQPGGSSGALVIALTVVVAAAAMFAGWMMRYLPANHELGWAAVPFLGIGAIVALDVLTSDGSVPAQVFFFFPALYAASQLKRHGAATVCACAVAGVAVVTFATASAGSAVLDLVYVGAALLTTAALLIRAGERQDELVAQLQHQATIDALTGLATRRVLDQAAQAALSGAVRAEGTALIVIDIDNFKSVNDRHGHPGGDHVLVQLAALLTAGCRKGDVVSRLGGDEIALLLPGCSYDDLLNRADQILWAVRAQQFVVGDGPPISLSISAGLAHAPTHASDLRSLYAAADAALYDAKRAGRDRVGVPPTPVAGPLVPDDAQLLTPTLRTPRRDPDGPLALRRAR